MNDGFQWWLILVGAVVTLAVIWVFAIRLPRAERDVDDDERRAEAAWISETIERFGGVAPTELVEEVLELHAEYLAAPQLARIPDRAVGAGETPALGETPVPAGPDETLEPAPADLGGRPLGAPPVGVPRTVSGPTLPPPIPPPPPLGRADRLPPAGPR